MNGKTINYSVIDEELAGYDDSLPQHYGVPTIAFDWTLDPCIAIYFALQNTPADATHFSIHAYKELHRSSKNPFVVEKGNPDCRNPRIAAQKGYFIRFQHPCLFYFVHGRWPTMEDYLPLNAGNFELISYDIPVTEKEYFLEILHKNKITKDTLKLD